MQLLDKWERKENAFYKKDKRNFKFLAYEMSHNLKLNTQFLTETSSSKIEKNLVSATNSSSNLKGTTSTGSAKLV